MKKKRISEEEKQRRINNLPLSWDAIDNYRVNKGDISAELTFNIRWNGLSNRYIPYFSFSSPRRDKNTPVYPSIGFQYDLMRMENAFALLNNSVKTIEINIGVGFLTKGNIEEDIRTCISGLEELSKKGMKKVRRMIQKREDYVEGKRSKWY